MLVLTRRVGETLMIGDNVTVTVLDVKGGEAHIEIVAPKDVPVDREEVRARKRTDDEFVIKPALDRNNNELGHLQIARRPGQRFLIGDKIAVTVTKINGRQVHIGVDAPMDVPVHREEIYNRINEGSPKDDDVFVIHRGRQGTRRPDEPLDPPPSRGPGRSHRPVLGRTPR